MIYFNKQVLYILCILHFISSQIPTLSLDFFISPIVHSHIFMYTHFNFTKRFHTKKTPRKFLGVYIYTKLGRNSFYAKQYNIFCNSITTSLYKSPTNLLLSILSLYFEGYHFSLHLLPFFPQLQRILLFGFHILPRLEFPRFYKV